MLTSSTTASIMVSGTNKARKVGNNIVIPVPTAIPYDAESREKQPLLMEEGGSRRHQFDTSVSTKAEYFPEAGFMKELFSRDNRMVSGTIPLSRLSSLLSISLLLSFHNHLHATFYPFAVALLNNSPSVFSHHCCSFECVCVVCGELCH